MIEVAQHFMLMCRLVLQLHLVTFQIQEQSTVYIINLVKHQTTKTRTLLVINKYTNKLLCLLWAYTDF